jgi:hypothetical protein
VSMTITPHPLAPGACRPADLAELVEVHDQMTAVLGADPERYENPHARAIYLLDATLLRRASRTEKP